MDDEIFALERQIEELKEKLSEARRRRPEEPVEDYEFAGSDGTTVRLSQLFGEKDDLIVIHNMGQGCPNCTMWADGFTGMLPHLEDRASFVVVSPDPPEVQQEFAASRGWNFRMLSSQGSTFVKDMGYQREDGKYRPGVSAFHRTSDGVIVRTGHDSFGPGDDYCPPWRMFDLLAGGSDGWQPRFHYD